MSGDVHGVLMAGLEGVFTALGECFERQKRLRLSREVDEFKPLIETCVWCLQAWNKTSLTCMTYCTPLCVRLCDVTTCCAFECRVCQHGIRRHWRVRLIARVRCAVILPRATLLQAPGVSLRSVLDTDIQHNKALSNLAFVFNLRLCNTVSRAGCAAGRLLHQGRAVQVETMNSTLNSVSGTLVSLISSNLRVC